MSNTYREIAQSEIVDVLVQRTKSKFYCIEQCIGKIFDSVYSDEGFVYLEFLKNKKTKAKLIEIGIGAIDSDACYYFIDKENKMLQNYNLLNHELISYSYSKNLVELVFSNGIKLCVKCTTEDIYIYFVFYRDYHKIHNANLVDAIEKENFKVRNLNLELPYSHESKLGIDHNDRYLNKSFNIFMFDDSYYLIYSHFYDKYYVCDQLRGVTDFLKESAVD